MKIGVVVISLILSGCAGTGFSVHPEQDQAVAMSRAGKPEDVRFCQYEAEKAPSQAISDNMIVQALQGNEERMRIFSACMRYKSR